MSFSNIDLSDCKGILIDLDDTIYNYQTAHRFSLDNVRHQFFPDLPLADFRAEYRAARNAVMDRLAPQGCCRSRLFTFLELLERRDCPAAFLRARAMDRLYWQGLIGRIEPEPGAIALLERARAAGIGICIVSDMTVHVQIDKIVKLGIADLVDFLVTSEEVGVEKPDPRIFEAGLRKLGLQADEVIMIGDSLEKDIHGAEKLGIRAFRVALGEVG